MAKCFHDLRYHSRPEFRAKARLLYDGSEIDRHLPVLCVAPRVRLGYSSAVRAQLAPSWRELSRFYIPLALQTLTQSITHPFNQIVAARGALGPADLAGYSQGRLLLFMIGFIGAGLLTTGLVHARNRSQWRRFSAVVALTIAGIILIHGLVALPSISRLVFGSALGLPTQVAERAVVSFRLLMPVQFFLLLRVPFKVILYNNQRTGLAYWATLARVVGTVTMSLGFVRLGLVGPVYASIAFLVPLILENLVVIGLALPVLGRMPEGRTEERIPSLLAFSLYLSAGQFILVFSRNLVTMLIARSPDPEIMLAIHHSVDVIVGPLIAATSGMIGLTIQFRGNPAANHRIRQFTVVSGAAASLLTALMLAPSFVRLYFVYAQEIPEAWLSLIRASILPVLIIPFMASVQHHLEGVATSLKHPRWALAGKVAYSTALFVGALILLRVGVPGNLLGRLSMWPAYGAGIAALTILKRLNAQGGAVA